MSGVQNYHSAKNREIIRRLKLALEECPSSITDICESLGLNKSSGWKLLSPRIDFHIVRYERRQFSWVALWGAGPGIDAIKPVWVPLPKVNEPKPDYPRIARERTFGFMKQPVRRDWAVEMLFGQAVNLNAELAGMRP